ncbi:SusC/RagA family TonB-linked outer membrane protein [Cyclobacterium marinum]|uniref:SusC/RagA family TonB-linked outer membrane protein n=1 Tax=Cyclobacterium marinum TaxID=104 RepID=UPI0011F090C6|nr:TonB-dependent receptor [Cyclobacterium marinum]MBI0399555.1 TonB-dependent receptor [Cyclobacterium marinum]
MRNYYYTIALLLCLFNLGNNQYSLGQELLSFNKFDNYKQSNEAAKTMTFKKAMEQFGNHYGVSFLYRKDLLDHQLVSPPSLSGDKGKGLEDMLAPLGVSYKELRKDYIVIFSREEKNGNEEDKIDHSQLRFDSVIKGVITEESGEPLPGATIMVKGTNIGTVTDLDGAYTITIPDNIENPVLEFSFIGFSPQEVAVGTQTEINVTLSDNLASLNEVVVIGYGAVKKSDLTGAVSSVKASEIQQTPITSIDQGLVGRASGVMVTQTSGMPGAVASIRIRGSSSLQGGNEPLYVIDGFPVYSGAGFGETGGNARMSGLSTINPADIESIEILKDASATAIYGARAANGVVLITTKSGKEGRDQVTFDAYYGVQKVVQKIDVMNAYDYATLVNEAYTNDGLSPVYGADKMAELQANPKGTDWQEEIFRAAPVQNYQLSFSGGDKKTNYAVSGNYFNQEGVIINSGFKRYSGRVNIARNISNKFKVGTNFNVSKTMSNAVPTDAGGSGGVVTGAMKFNPILPVYSNQELGIYTQVNSPGIIYPNPVASALEQVRESAMLRVLGNIFGEYEFVPNLVGKVSFGTDLVNTKFDTFIPTSIFESNGIAKATVNGGYTTNWLNENTLSWNKKISDLHSVSLLGGITFQKNFYESLMASSQDFVNNSLEENALGSGSVYNQPGSSKTEWSLVSYLGRVNYNFNEKYLLSLNGRIDGSSRFGDNNKYAFFPSGALAWRAIEEDFIQNMNVFSNLKARISYGVTGNQEIGLYNSLPTLTNTTYTIGGALATGFYPNSIPNPNLRWEKTSQFDFGLDFGFFDERLRFTTDYYFKKTIDLIYNVAVPFVSGFGSSLQNIGSIQNQGVELMIGADILAQTELKWTSSFNISFNRNKVLELGGESYKDVGGGDGHLKTGSVHRLIVGQPIGLFYGYVSDGIIQNAEELAAGPVGPTNWIGGRRYLDISGPNGVPDGVVNATYDRAIIGDPNPDFFGGFTNTISYKGFELNAFTQFSYGADIFNYNAMELELPSGGQNVYSDLVNRWTPSNPSDVYPKATTNRSAVFSDVFMEDGSYLKIKTLTLGYTFPASEIKALSGLKLYITGQNLFTFTNYSGYDPEVSYRGATNLQLGEDFGGYPQSRTFMIGAKINFQ